MARRSSLLYVFIFLLSASCLQAQVVPREVLDKYCVTCHNERLARPYGIPCLTEQAAPNAVAKSHLPEFSGASHSAWVSSRSLTNDYYEKGHLPARGIARHGRSAGIAAVGRDGARAIRTG